MICKTETELAKRLACTRSALANWRKDYGDAPRNRDVAAWEEFLVAYNLGTRAPGRVSFPPGGLRRFVEERIISAEEHLLFASFKIRDHAPDHYREFEALRRRFFLLTFHLYKVAAKL